MGVFDDKKFEELDWISQATEPIDSKLNQILVQIPDEIEIDFQKLKTFSVDSWVHGFSVNRVIRYYSSEFALSWQEGNLLETMFEFQVVGEPIANYETKTIAGGSIKIVKIAQIIDEQVMKKFLGSEAIDHIQHMSLPTDSLPRLNDVLELLGKCDDGLKTKSIWKKRTAIFVRFKEIFASNEWNIKDTELATKVGLWVANYVTNSDAAAYANFCRLKVMTHKGLPIYSMEEIK